MLLNGFLKEKYNEKHGFYLCSPKRQKTENICTTNTTLPFSRVPQLVLSQRYRRGDVFKDSSHVAQNWLSESSAMLNWRKWPTQHIQGMGNRLYFLLRWTSKSHFKGHKSGGGGKLFFKINQPNHNKINLD